MKNKIILPTLLSLTLFFVGCSKNGNITTDPATPKIPTDSFIVAAAAPTFTSFFPKTSFLGDTITIYGGNLDKNLSNLHVSFGGIDALIASATATFAKVLVPNDFDEPVVKIKLGNGKTTLVSQDDFILKPAVIDSVSYTKGFPGQQLIIKGKGFRNSYHIGQLRFNNVIIDPSLTNVGNNELLTTVPKGLSAGKYDIGVSIAGMKTTAPSQFEVVVPGITSISPDAGRQNTVMTIVGENLKDIYGIGVPTIVSFSDAQTGKGSTVGTVLSTEQNRIKVSVPHLQAGHSYKVMVQVVRGSVQAIKAFSYTG